MLIIEDEIINFKKYKIFKLNDEIYLYLCDFSGLYKIDENIVKVLENNGTNRKEIYYNLKDCLTELEIENILDNLEKLDIISKEDECTCKERNDLQSITLMLSQDCNMRCSYCFAGDGQYNNKGYMDIDIAKKAIDFIIDNSKHKDISVCLFGGEPLLNFKLFKEIVEYCRYIEKSVDKNIFITTTINGTLLTEEIEMFMLDNKISILVSIDGDEKTHDSNRYFENKVGSYNKIMKNIDNMREKGLLSVRATVTKNNLDMVQIFNHLYDLNFKKIPIVPAINLFELEDFEALKNSYDELILYFSKLIKDKEFEKAKKMIIIFKCLLKIHYGRDRNLSCGASVRGVAVDIDGNIYPCHRFVSDRRFIIGNVFKDNIEKEKFTEKFNVENIGKCKNCWAKSLCVTSCPKEFIEHEESENPNKFNICKLNKYLYEKLIYLYLELTNEEKEVLFK